MNTGRKISAYTTFLTVFAVMAACTRPQEYPAEPYIEFRQNNLTYELDALGDTIRHLEVEFYFQDGDGDLGGGNGNDNDSNLYFILYEMKGNMDSPDYTQVFLPDSGGNLIPFSYPYTLPYIEPVNYNGNLRGTIRWSVEDFPITTYMMEKRTICYQIYLFDRAGHKSNVIFTDPIKL